MKQSNKPNILFLFADDQRFDTIGALGNPQIITPNLDKIVNKGTTFTQAHIPGGTCGAVCMPSRAMVNTSMSLFKLHEHGLNISEEHVLLGEIFKNKGYETCGIGKWHNGPRSYARSFTCGGEIFFGGMWDHWNIPANKFDPTGKYKNVIPYASDFYHSRTIDNMVADHITPGKHSTELFGEKAIDYLKNRKKGKPFYLYTAFMAPHDPRTMPEKFRKMYNPEDIELPKNYMPKHPFEYGIHDLRDEILEDYPREKSKIRKHIAEYYGMISHLDNEIGLIIEALKETGEYDNTIIIFSGDNGLALGQHGLMGKQNAYEASVRVPLIFMGPGIAKGYKCDAPCYLMDILPTVCDLIGADKPEGIDGMSLFPAFNMSVFKGRDIMYYAYAEFLRGVEYNSYKLIVYATEGEKRFQLFNLENDPLELVNLRRNSDYSDILEEMKKKLLAQRLLWKDDGHIEVSKIFWDNYFSSEEQPC